MSKGDLYIRCDFFEQPWILALKKQSDEDLLIVFYIHLVARDCRSVKAAKKLYHTLRGDLPFKKELQKLENFGLVKIYGDELTIVDSPYICLDKEGDGDGRDAVV